ncbi:MAG: c-type cytochrome [Acidiphilium sp.]
MSMHESRHLALPAALCLALISVAAWAAAPGSGPSIPRKDYGIGQTATAGEMKGWDITIGPAGRNLPPGHGSVAAGKVVYAQQCASCHGARGQGGIGPRLQGGIGSLASNTPIKDVGSYWPYATTLFDYIRRAMPFDHPQSLSNDQVYAVSAYILRMNRIVPANAVMDRTSLPKVAMPNRHGFVWHEGGQDKTGHAKGGAQP